MRRLLIVALAVGALVQAGTASAGCWATVGLAPPPDGIAPGDTWTARLTVLQHGRTPLPDAKTARPTLTIRNDATGAERTFVAQPTKDLTVFTTTVVFPSAGSWSYEVFDGFTTWQGEPAPCAQTHTFSAVSVGGAPVGGGEPPAPAPRSTPPLADPIVASAESSGDGFPVWPVVGSALAALAAFALGAGLVRRRRRGPEMAVR
jgi:MYXO-CTERM domain-containing protein